jgi:hypothetical protein
MVEPQCLTASTIYIVKLVQIRQLFYKVLGLLKVFSLNSS